MTKIKLITISLLLAVSANISTTTYADGTSVDGDSTEPAMTRCEYLESVGITHGFLWEIAGCSDPEVEPNPDPNNDIICQMDPERCQGGDETRR